ncbi:hypothetical protein AMTRI_Chr02g220050 [Amborella trichopoda]|uniref:Small ribosomal subunit protein uS17c n=1 Tax=Amborella trichopoda TaxID=13333 RepID=W1P6Q8_AMBTC|nr:30S ribosomal protein S17, chloroplastic [Amborella trichopoda]ERN03266.1 hypothetical protein AMTR_s00003p00201470 [Amborella trichopoda]|eukprot:XP_006841591.1 30S ribosomal protein S17, chloroplastic [Amborella trichopoda]
MMVLSSHPLQTSFANLSISKNKNLSPFLNGSSSITLPTPSHRAATAPPPFPFLRVEAMKKMLGRVVCSTSDKTVAVEVVRLAPHPKYKRRVRKKKKYQAHDPLNQFKVGDFVQLEKSRPISKTKTFVAVAVVARNAPKPKVDVPQELDLPLESAEQA